MNYKYLLDRAYMANGVDPESVQSVYKQIIEMSNSNFLGVNSYFIADYKLRKHIFLSKGKIFGFTTEAIVDGGLEFILSRWNSSDVNIFSNEIAKNIIELSNTYDIESFEQLVFSTSYRVIDASNNVLKILQNSKYICDPNTGLPALSYGTITDITDFKADESLLWKVTQASETENSNLIVKKVRFFSGNELDVFTKREKEILKMVADGLTAKEIAQKLFISESTVINHKKNMQIKTNSKNTVELINYAYAAKLL